MIQKIISGGQTGGDQGGLLAATRLGLKTGGWMPRGWKTEHGSEPWLENLGLREHPSPQYPPRTEANVRDSDGTLIFGNPGSRGCDLTRRVALRHEKPVFTVVWASKRPLPLKEVPRFRQWLDENGIEVLNVAGNRESSQPGIMQAVADFLVNALQA